MLKTFLFLILFCVLAAIADAATPNLFNIGFETAPQRQTNCGTGGVFCAAPYAAVTLAGAYVNDASFCRTGSWCASHVLPGGLFQSSMMHDIQVSTAYQGKYWFAAWKFPTTFRFQNGDIDWKAMIWEGAVNRLYLNFRVNGSDKTRATPAFCINECLTGADWVYASGGERVMTDGAWHSYEVYTASNSLKLWIDNVLEIDITNAVLTSTVGEWKVGAYMNSTIPFTETFYLDDLGVSTVRIGATVTPPIAPSNLLVK